MDLEGLQCHGCGSTNVTFDPKRRILSCNQCGKEEYYSRSTLNANGKVVYARRNAIHFFKEGRMDDAKHYAMEVLNISMDNAPAMYILAYYDEFTARKPDSMRMFFDQIMDVALEYDEVRDICSLIMGSAYNLADFEEQVIQLIAVNMQSPDDARELCTVIDMICPFLISKRTSAGYLTDNLVDMYRELAEHCGIPKTCFALLKSIETNPDSPYVGQSFYLKAKVRYFYDNYVVNVGKVIRAMNDANMKAKFIGAYESKCQQYKADAGMA